MFSFIYICIAVKETKLQYMLAADADPGLVVTHMECCQKLSFDVKYSILAVEYLISQL